METSSPIKCKKITSSSANTRNRWSDEYSAMVINMLANEKAAEVPKELWQQNIAQCLHHDAPVEGCIYVFGGRCSKVLESQHYLNSVEMLDPFRNEWITLPPMATSRVGAAAAEVDGNLYVVGGYKTHPDDPLASMECFNPLTGKWAELAPMNKARFGHAMAAINNRYIYVMGGDSRRVLVTDVERYDVLTNTWTTVGSLPAPVAGGRMLERNGKFYLVGGDVGTQPLSFTDKIRIFDPLTNKWEVNEALLSTGRSACAVTWALNKTTSEEEIVVFGGYAADADNFFELSSGEAVTIEKRQAAQIPLTANATARPIPSLQEPRAGCRAVTLGNKIYIIGGESPAPPVNVQSSAAADVDLADQDVIDCESDNQGMATVTRYPAQNEQESADFSLLNHDDDHATSTGSEAALLSTTANAALQLLSALDSSYPHFQTLNSLFSTSTTSFPQSPILSQATGLSVAAEAPNSDQLNGNTASSIIQALRARLGVVSPSSASPTVYHSGAIFNQSSSAFPNSFSQVLSNERKLHSEVVVFDCDSWTWSPASTVPPMTVARTAAAVCVGKGYPRSYQGRTTNGCHSSLRWATECAMMQDGHSLVVASPELPSRRFIAASG